MQPDIINTERYPINQLSEPAGQCWISEIRERLELDGCCTLPQFVTQSALAQMASQAHSILSLAYPGPTEVSPYFFNYRLGEAENLPASHPLRHRGKRILAQVAADLIPTDFLLSQLHRSEQMLNFLAAVTEKPVYPNRDPYQSLNISVMNEGGCQQWHFDSGNMVTTLLLQEPEGGGVFEYAPAIRTDHEENFAAVQAILENRSKQVLQNRLSAGSLSLFRGHYSLHRVTPVIGKRPRIQAILGYSSQADFYGNRESSILHYGPRVAAIEASTPHYPD